MGALILLIIYIAWSFMSWAFLDWNFPKNPIVALMGLVLFGWFAIACAVFARILGRR